MTGMKPTVGFEPVDKYEKARQDVLNALKSISALTPMEKKRLFDELSQLAKIDVLLEMIKSIN